MSNLNPSSVLTVLFPLISLSNLFMACQVILLTNAAQLSLVKETATFLPKLLNQEPRHPPDSIILDV